MASLQRYARRMIEVRDFRWWVQETSSLHVDSVMPWVFEGNACPVDWEEVVGCLLSTSSCFVRSREGTGPRKLHPSLGDCFWGFCLVADGSSRVHLERFLQREANVKS